MECHTSPTHSLARRRGCDRPGFTILEMLTTLTIITILIGLLLPALNQARSASRKMQCQANLRQLGLALQNRADSQGQYCSGAFSWKYDGCVTEYGWVADLVDAKVPVGDLLCPGNTAQLSETYLELMTMVEDDFDPSIDPFGPEGKTQPDGTVLANPCYQMLTTPDAFAPESPERATLLDEELLAKKYNTNYVATWYLVRGEVDLDDDGNPTTSDSTDWPASPTMRPYTDAGLKADSTTTSTKPSNTIPLLACAQATGTLPYEIGDFSGGTVLAKSFTPGPVMDQTMQPPPEFADDTPRNGADGWWAVWAKETIQDYRAFDPVHGRACNILFADGSVRAFPDVNKDGFLNSGFPPTASNGFEEGDLDLPPEDVANIYSLKDRDMQ